MSFFWLIKMKHYNNSYRSYKKIQTESPKSLFLTENNVWYETAYKGRGNLISILWRCLIYKSVENESCWAGEKPDYEYAKFKLP